MKKEELKDVFEKEFEKISVSDELKVKTINSINTKHIGKTSHLPYLRNFAAIFTVTLLCVSIYFTNNYTKKQYGSFDAAENEAISDVGTTKSDLQLKNALPESTSALNQDAEINRSFGAYDDFSVEKTSPSSLQFNSIESALSDMAKAQKESLD